MEARRRHRYLFMYFLYIFFFISIFDFRLATRDPRVESFVPRGESFVPRVESFVPRGESFVPRVESFVPRGESCVPRVESFVPRVESFVPRPAARDLFILYFIWGISRILFLAVTGSRICQPRSPSRIVNAAERRTERCRLGRISIIRFQLTVYFAERHVSP